MDKIEATSRRDENWKTDQKHEDTPLPSSGDGQLFQNNFAPILFFFDAQFLSQLFIRVLNFFYWLEAFKNVIRLS